MKKATTSDAMKDLLAAISTMPGTADDWKRLSKRKDEQGLLVREFQNKVTGEQIALTETGNGQVSIRQTVRSRSRPGFTPVMDNDPSRNAKADAFIDSLIAMDYALDLETAGPQAGTALANRFIFAYCDTPDGACWIVTPQKYWQDEGAVFDQQCFIEHLMPANAGEVTEATWVIEPEYFNPLRRAVDLMARGFIFDPDFQRAMDSTQEPLIAAITRGRQAAPHGPKPG